MKKEKMTIHRALAELKLIDAKIGKQISTMSPVGIKQKDKLVDGFSTEEDFKTQAQAKFDSVTALITRKVALKSAVVKANGETMVKVAGVEMSIADAITMKSTVAFKKALVGKLKQTHDTRLGQLFTNNDQVNANVQRILEATFGKENVKATKEDMEAVRKPYIEANEFLLVDPIKVLDKVEALEKEIGDFEMEVDATLSEINAITFIEI